MKRCCQGEGLWIAQKEPSLSRSLINKSGLSRRCRFLPLGVDRSRLREVALSLSLSQEETAVHEASGRVFAAEV